MGRLKFAIPVTTIICIAASSDAAAHSACRQIDFYKPFERLASATTGLAREEQLRAFHNYIAGPTAVIYTRPVLSVEPGSELDRRALVALADARAGAPRAEVMEQLDRDLHETEQQFHHRFSDFRCNFTVYYVDSMMQLDGAGRVVDGHPALVFGIDQLAQERAAISLRVFVAHEMFHRYHLQAAGFSDDPGEHQEIWRALWAEGLASYASMVVVPGATADDALMLPADLEARTAPLIKTIASDLLAHFDRVDTKTYNTYFSYGDPQVSKRGLPWRSGYCIGFLIAKELAKTHSLDQLAHLRSDQLKQMIVTELRKMST